MSLSCGKTVVNLDLSSECARIAPTLKATATQLESLLAEFDSRL